MSFVTHPFLNNHFLCINFAGKSMLKNAGQSSQKP